jgi:hypothetical protein
LAGGVAGVFAAGLDTAVFVALVLTGGDPAGVAQGLFVVGEPVAVDTFPPRNQEKSDEVLQA